MTGGGLCPHPRLSVAGPLVPAGHRALLHTGAGSQEGLVDL